MSVKPGQVWEFTRGEFATCLVLCDSNDGGHLVLLLDTECRKYSGFEAPGSTMTLWLENSSWELLT